MPDVAVPTPSMAIDPCERRRQLERILSSPAFRATPRRRAFLRYIVEEDAAGRIGGLKGYAIAVAVYGRDSSFDARLDPLVRIEAGRLRADLDQYYQTAGQDDPLLIEIPKGANVPRFSPRRQLAQDRPGKRMMGLPAWSRRSTVIGMLATGVAIGACLGVWLATAWPGRAGAAPSIAILPFTAPDDDAQQTSFARGVVQELAKNLSQMGSLRVIPPSAVTPVDQLAPQNLRRAPGTGSLVEGTVQRAGATIRVSVRLVDVTSGALIWGESYLRSYQAEQTLGIEDDIARSIAAMIGGDGGVLARTAPTAGLASQPGGRR